MSYMWTWDEIVREWLGGARIAILLEIVVEAFNRVERLLGGEWLQSCRRTTDGGLTTGVGPALAVVSMGRKLAALDGAKNSAGLLQRRERDRSAVSELTGVFLCEVST